MRNYLLTGPVVYHPLYYWAMFDVAVTPASRIFAASARSGATQPGAVSRITTPVMETGFTPGASSRVFTPGAVDRTDE